MLLVAFAAIPKKDVMKPGRFWEKTQRRVSNMPAKTNRLRAVFTDDEVSFHQIQKVIKPSEGDG